MTLCNDDDFEGINNLVLELHIKNFQRVVHNVTII